MPRPSFDVLSYGTVGVDRILRVPHWPSPDISTHASEETIHLGGKATNCAALLATWGLQVAVSGTTIGDDETGAKLRELLARFPGISTKYLRFQAGLTSMYCCILVNPNGERAIIGVHADQVPQTPPTSDMIRDARVLTLDLYGGYERIEAARMARAAGIPVIVGDVRDAAHPVLDSASVAIASAAELCASGLASPEEFAQVVRAGGTSQVIITQGSQPVLVFDERGGRTEIEPPIVEVVDTTGAGDAFRAGVTFGVAKGLSVIESAALGAAAGSLSVRHVGAASKPPGLEEIQQVARTLIRRSSSV